MRRLTIGAPEQTVLKALLAPLHQDAGVLRLPRGAADDLVLTLARHHRLSPALSMVTFDGVSTALQETFRHDRLLTLGRATLFKAALREVVGALHAAGVQVIVLKGMAYEALVYPTPGTRPATDIDLLVRPLARPAAFEVFRKLGFMPAMGGPGFADADYHEVTFQRDDIYVDLHFALVPVARCSIDYDALWAASVPLSVAGVMAQVLSRPHCLVHHALHMAVHHFDVPAIYLLDVARLVAAGTVTAEVTSVARRWGCLRPWQTTVTLTVAFIPNAGAQDAGGPHASGRRGPVAGTDRGGSDVLFPVLSASASRRAARVVRTFGAPRSLPRPEQIRRKLEHFDNKRDMLRYLRVQGRRLLAERLWAAHPPRTAAERLGWR